MTEPDDHGLGRSRGGLTTKLHLAVEQGQKPLSLLVTAGQRHDSPQFQPVLEGIRVPRPGPGRPRTKPDRVRADRAYGSRANRSYLRRRGIGCTIPEKADQVRNRKKLGFLAHHLVRLDRDQQDLAWWQLGDSARPSTRILITALVAASCIAVPDRLITLPLSPAGLGLGAASLEGLLMGLTASPLGSSVLLGGFVMGVATACAVALKRADAGRVDLTAPAVIEGTLINMVVYGVLGPMNWSLPSGLIIGGIGGSLAYTFCFTAWGRWVVLVRLRLPLTGRLPWRTVAFLDDAYRRGVLRRTGAVHQFGHLRIQHHLGYTCRAGRANFAPVRLDD